MSLSSCRDIKPQSVLIDSDGHVKLSDFGMSFSDPDSLSFRLENFVTQLQASVQALKASQAVMRAELDTTKLRVEEYTTRAYEQAE